MPKFLKKRKFCAEDDYNLSSDSISEMSLSSLDTKNGTNRIPCDIGKYLNYSEGRKSTANREHNESISNTKKRYSNVNSQMNTSYNDNHGLISSDEEMDYTKKVNEKSPSIVKTLLLESPELSTSISEKEKKQKYSRHLNNINSDFSDDDYSSDQNDSVHSSSNFFNQEMFCNSSPNHLLSENKTNNSNTGIKTNRILDYFNVSLGKDIVNGVRDIEKIKYNYNIFNKPIQLNELSLYFLLKHKNSSTEYERLFFDKLAQMIYLLAGLFKKNEIIACQSCYNLFKNLYYIDNRLLKKWTGLTFIEFMETEWCSPYFKIKYNDVKNEYVVEKFNQSMSNSLILDCKYDSTGNKNDKAINEKVNSNKTSGTLEIYQEKLEWLKFLSLRTEDLDDIPFSLFSSNFKSYFKIKLNCNYLKSKFKKNCLSEVFNSYFNLELKLIRKMGRYYIRVLCQLPSKIVETKKIIEDMELEQYGNNIRRNSNYENQTEISLVNNIIEFRDKNFDMLQLKKESEIAINTGSNEKRVGLSKMINSDQKQCCDIRKIEYVVSNVVLSEDEESSNYGK
uniref:DUF4210 domain-containing protein n=1 Tax=Strongyloides venezuelensis TaxID=75913 RepID=A0A0K0F7S5_STRVS